MKRLLSVVLVLAVIFTTLAVSAVSASAQSYDTTITIGSTTYIADVGDTFTYTYYLDYSSKLASAQLELPVDFSMLSGDTEAALNNNIGAVAPIAYSSAVAVRFDTASKTGLVGYVFNFASDSGYSFSGSKVAFKVSFKVLKKGSVKLDATLREVVDVNGNDIVDINGVEHSASFSSSAVLDLPYPNSYSVKAPRISALSNASNGVKLTWGAVSGAAKYRIYKKSGAGWSKLADTTSTSYTDTSATSSGTEYSYTVRCLNSSGSAVSDYVRSGWTIMYVGVPSVSKFESTLTGVKVTWGKVTGAVAYRLYRKNGSSWKKVADTASTSFTDTGAVTSNTKYTYTVRCLDAANATCSAYNTTGFSTTFIAAPVISSVANAATGVKITWGKVAGAAKYRVFRKLSGGSWTRAADTTAVTYTDTSVSSGTVYYYTVRCINSAASAYTSGYDTTGKSLTYISAPAVPSLANTADGVKITWTAPAGSENYRVFRKAGSATSWSRVADTTAVTYTDTSVASGTQYTYTIRCINAAGTGYTSAYNTTGKSITYIAAPTISSVANAATGVKVTWAKVTGAAKYRVFRKTSGGSWAKVGDTTSTTYTDTTAQSGTTYYYTVRCINSAGSSYTSAYDTTGKSLVYIAAPAVPSLSNTTTGIKISWTAPTGAVNYRIFRKAGSATSWSRVADTTDLSYTDTTVSSGTQYTYTIRCLSKDGSSYTSAYNTTGKSINYIAAPTVTSLAKVSTGVKVTWGKVTGAAKYRVFRKVSGGSWAKLGDTTSTAYTDTTAKSGTTYYYTVRCINSAGSSYTSAYDTAGKSIAYTK